MAQKKVQPLKLVIQIIKNSLWKNSYSVYDINHHRKNVDFSDEIMCYTIHREMKLVSMKYANRENAYQR